MGRISRTCGSGAKELNIGVQSTLGARLNVVPASRWRPAAQNWWRRRELNPRPQALDFRIYARSPFFVSHPTLPEGQGRRQTS